MPLLPATEILGKERYLIPRKVVSSMSLTFSYSVRDHNPLLAQAEPSGGKEERDSRQLNQLSICHIQSTEQVCNTS